MENCKYLESQYLNENTADVHFIIENKESFAAHKGILAANSLVLQKHFKESIDVKHIEIPNVSSEAFKEFLFAFYSKYPEKKYTLGNAASILSLAKMFDFVFCIHTYETFLLKNVNIDTACWCYSIAKRYELVELELFCNKKINTNMGDVFKSKGFFSCDVTVLEDVLRCLTITCRAEVKIVWDGCLKWAEKKCVEQSIDHRNMKNRQKLLGKCFDIMCSIAVHDIAVLQHFKRVLNENEHNSIQTISDKGTSCEQLVFSRFQDTMLATDFVNANDVTFIQLQTTTKIVLNGIALASVTGKPKGQIDICIGENQSIWSEKHLHIDRNRDTKNVISIENVVFEPHQIYTIKLNWSKDTVFYRSRLVSHMYQDSNVKIAINQSSRRDLISHLFFTSY